VQFLADLRDGKRPQGRIIRGHRCPNLDALPVSDFAEFYEQRRRLLPHSRLSESRLEIPYETSRGCWWNGCHFCGLNGREGGFRRKSSDKVVRDLGVLLEQAPTRRVRMLDNVMAPAHLRDLVPRLSRELPPMEIFFEVRPTLTLQDVMELRKAGIVHTQPGIESLSSSLLRRMGKGTTVTDAVAFLRYASAVGIGAAWNLLWGFPGDRIAEYEESVELAAKLHHLPAPRRLGRMVICRFCHYFETPERFGISNLRPCNEMSSFLPSHADASGLASHFDARFPSESLQRIDVVLKLFYAVRLWQFRWSGLGTALCEGPPRLHITAEPNNRYALEDTRELSGGRRILTIDEKLAEYALVTRPQEDTPEASWAVEHGVAVVRDDSLIALATADPRLMLEFEARAKLNSKQRATT
jgi:ribosomal peptide maturation radical SAM protein 1